MFFFLFYTNYAPVDGCCGFAVIVMPISDVGSVSIGVFINVTVTVIVVVAPCSSVLGSAILYFTSKYSVFVFLDTLAVNSADKSLLVFSIVYVAVASSPFAVNPETFIVAANSSCSLILAVTLLASETSGVPVNLTVKF